MSDAPAPQPVPAPSAFPAPGAVAPPPPPPPPPAPFVAPGMAYQQVQTMAGGPAKSKVTAALFAAFLGPFGAHRFYTGHIGSAVAMLLLSLSIIGIFATVPWAIIDLITILTGSKKDSTGRPLV